MKGSGEKRRVLQMKGEQEIRKDKNEENNFPVIRKLQTTLNRCKKGNTNKTMIHFEKMKQQQTNEN